MAAPSSSSPRIPSEDIISQKVRLLCLARGRRRFCAV
jgi:hypothetical protein